tara:strand:+ start:1899 stop:4211 length:2313 start_codon:yes stop_codon:yes gene_type:complete
MSLPRSLLLLIASLAIGMSVWFGMQSGGTHADVLGAGRDGVGEPEVRANRPPDRLRNDGNGASPVEKEQRVPAQEDPKADAQWVVVRGFVVDRQGSPVRMFTILETHEEFATLDEVVAMEDQPIDFVLGAEFDSFGEILLSKSNRHAFDSGTGAFEVLLPLGSKLELEAVADGYGSFVSSSAPNGPAIWKTRGLSVPLDADLPTENVDGVMAYRLEDCLPKQEPSLRLVLARKGLITGRVVTPTGPIGEGAAVVSTGNWNETFSCDSEGNFKITAEGSIDLTAKHKDWVPSDPVEYDLHAGQSVKGVRLLLRAGGRLTGQVFDSNGLAMAGLVYLHYSSGPGPEPPSQDDELLDGNFEFERLVPGKYIVRFEPVVEEDGDYVDELEQMLLADATIVDGETTHVVLGGIRTDTVRLHGTMTDADEPVANGTVFALLEGNATKASWKIGRTDEHGAYELILNGPGNYIVAGGRTTSGDPPIERFVYVPDVQEFELNLAFAEGSIQGTVTDANGDPAKGVHVFVSAKNPTMFALDFGRGDTTDSMGRYSVPHLSAGTYVLRLKRNETQVLGIRSGVNVAAGRATTDIDFTLGGAGVLKGHVVDADGAPVRNASVFVRHEGGDVVEESSMRTTDGQGAFNIPRLPAGTFTVLARKDGSTSLESSPITLQSGGIRSVELTLIQGTRVLVRTVGAKGRALSTTLFVRDAAGRDWGSLRTRADLERMRDEGFSSSERQVGPLPPGEYEFLAKDVNGREVRRKMKVTSDPEVTVTLKF